MIPESHLTPIAGPSGRYWSIQERPDGTYKIRGGPGYTSTSRSGSA